jgi:hypothetical protein
LTEATVWTGASSQYRNQTWNDNPELFGLKISWDLARAFMMEAALMVSPPDFLNSFNDSTHDVSSPFLYLLNLPYLTAWMM